MCDGNNNVVRPFCSRSIRTTARGRNAFKYDPRESNTVGSVHNGARVGNGGRVCATFVFRKTGVRTPRFIGVQHRRCRGWGREAERQASARSYFRSEIQYHQLLIKSDSDGNKTRVPECILCTCAYMYIIRVYAIYIYYVPTKLM